MRNIFLSFYQEDEIEANIWCRRFNQYFNDIRTLGLDEFGDDFAEHINSNDSDYVMRRIREKAIAGTSCTIVLVGKCTWARRYVDWEIAATLRNFDDSARGGLIGVQLPSAQLHEWSELPPRLKMNAATGDGADTGYARFYPPAPSDGSIAEWVEDAVARRDSMEPLMGSTSDLMINNRSCSQPRCREGHAVPLTTAEAASGAHDAMYRGALCAEGRPCSTGGDRVRASLVSGHCANAERAARALIGSMSARRSPRVLNRVDWLRAPRRRPAIARLWTGPSSRRRSI